MPQIDYHRQNSIKRAKNMAVTLEEIQSVDALKHLSEERLFALSKLMVKRGYAPGEIIFLEDEPAQGVWFILDGQVRIVKLSLHGRVQALCVAREGRCFGGCHLFDGDTNPAPAEAITPVELLILPGHMVEQLGHDDSELMYALLQIFSYRIALLARLGEGLGAWAVGARINDNLLRHAVKNGSHPVVPLTHEKLAELTGTVREVVSRHLARLEKQAVVQLEAGQIRLLNMEALRASCPISTEKENSGTPAQHGR